ncbi:MAG: fasciclin domain-containing protein [Xanthomonadales bacterium]|nr:fasciclin domain-containing protein [Gammaproteobacteria bacterium]NNK03149.1 fasciclin domain-containing protein [Xanthomonadales bacterium]
MTIQKLPKPLQKIAHIAILASAVFLFTLSANAGHHGDKYGKDIVDVAASNGSFNTLVAAVQAAGLEETLRGDGPFTVFAPTDEAFAKLPAGTLDSLLLPENRDKLAAILTYHVVAGKVMAADVVSLTSATTVNGQDVKISVDGETVMVDGATVVAVDVKASNGVIHVIDAVILPQ